VGCLGKGKVAWNGGKIMSEAKFNIDYWRQMDFITPDDLKGKCVTIIGCGGVGSFVGIALAKLGVEKFKLYDGDKVEEHNLPNQFFMLEHLGKTKSEALAEILKSFAYVDVESYGYWTDEKLEGFVISAVDSMEVRKRIWEVCKMNLDVSLLIDGRIGGESIVVRSVCTTDIDDIRLYETSLFDDDKAEELPCTARAIIDVAFTIAALITKALRAFIKERRRYNFVASLNNPTIMEVS